jgi:hypothetical protein
MLSKVSKENLVKKLILRMSAVKNTQMPLVSPEKVAKKSPEKKKRGLKKKVLKEEVVEKEEVEVNEEVEAKEVAVKEPVAEKKRAATLSAKHNKFIMYSFYLIKKMKEMDESIDTDALMRLAQVFGSTETQTKLVEDFLSSEKEVKASIKDVKKTEKEAQKAFAKTEKKFIAKVNRTKFVNVNRNDTGDILSVIFGKGAKAETVSDTSLLSSSLVLDAINTKLSPTQDLVAQIVSAANNNDSNLHDITVQPFRFQDTDYLIDNNNLLYHPTLHTHIATFHNNTQSITLI